MDPNKPYMSINGKQSNSESLRLNNDENNENINNVDALKKRVQKLEEQNANLKDIVIKLNKKIADIVDTNSKFISIISHDLRSPFNSILGILEILKKSLNNNDIPETNHLIDIAADSTHKTLDLLNSLLTWAASQNGTNTFNPVKINLYKLIEEEIDNFTVSTALKNINLHHSIAPDISVKADPQMVKTIIRNLINNAIKYTSKGGEIHIKASAKEPFIVIAVRDNGIGLSRESQIDLFKKNALNPRIGTDNEKGIGLGLLICKEFVDIHGGNILVESRDGKGSEFKFTLPRHP